LGCSLFSPGIVTQTYSPPKHLPLSLSYFMRQASLDPSCRNKRGRGGGYGCGGGGGGEVNCVLQVRIRMDVSDLFGECMFLRGGQTSYLDTWRGEWGGFGCEMVSSVMSLALYPSLFTVGVGVDVLSRVFVSTCLEAWCVGGDADVASGLSVGHVSVRWLDRCKVADRIAFIMLQGQCGKLTARSDTSNEQHQVFSSFPKACERLKVL
uniref:Secreted protein n=1 Tax=Taenia asiatica TaxID=60517 RepID=A0A0R3VY26_TAEAS